MRIKPQNGGVVNFAVFSLDVLRQYRKKSLQLPPAFPKINPYMQMRDELGSLYTNNVFVDLYPKDGQPGVKPWRLALVTMMSFAQNLTDRQAAEAVRNRSHCMEKALNLRLVFRRRIRSNGTIQVNKHTSSVDDKLAKRAVLVHLGAAKRCLRVTVDGVALAKPLPLKDLHAERLALFDYLKILQREAMSIAHYRGRVWRQSSEVA